MGDAMQLKDRIGCRMKLNDLHVLMAVVQAGSMGKAASVLNIGQPAISRSIADLEHALGARLLDRDHQGVKPTEYGRALLDGGTAVFDDLRQAVNKIALLADPAVGEVSVGCNNFLATSFVSVVIDRLSRRYPRVAFRLLPSQAQTLHRELIERQVDLLITRRAGPMMDERLDYEFLFDESYSVAVGARNPWARRRRVELSELLDQPWVLPPSESPTGSVAVEAFRASGIGYPRATVIAQPVDVRISLLAKGRFISIFPDSVFRFSAEGTKLKILPIRQPLGRAPVGIITLRNRTIGPLAQLFIAGSRELAKRMTRGKDVWGHIS
jgi:DNA-binding transcriptional LysR family regulator